MIERRPPAREDSSRYRPSAATSWLVASALVLLVLIYALILRADRQERNVNQDLTVLANLSSLQKTLAALDEKVADPELASTDTPGGHRRDRPNGDGESTLRTAHAS